MNKIVIGIIFIVGLVHIIFGMLAIFYKPSNEQIQKHSIMKGNRLKYTGGFVLTAGILVCIGVIHFWKTASEASEASVKLGFGFQFY